MHAFGEAVISQISQNLSELAVPRARNEKFHSKFHEIMWNPWSVSRVCFRRWRPP